MKETALPMLQGQGKSGAENEGKEEQGGGKDWGRVTAQLGGQPLHRDAARLPARATATATATHLTAQ